MLLTLHVGKVKLLHLCMNTAGWTCELANIYMNIAGGVSSVLCKAA